MPKKTFVICDVCLVLLKSNNYSSHQFRVHQIQVSNDFSLSDKIVADGPAATEKLLILNAKKTPKNKEKAPVFVYERGKARKYELNSASKSSQERTRIQKTLELQRNIMIDVNSIVVRLIWSYIEFGHNLIKFKVPGITIKAIEKKGILASLNLIKHEYFERLHPSKFYKVQVYKGSIVAAKSPGLTRILEVVEVAKEYQCIRSMKFLNLPQVIRTRRLSNKDIAALFDVELAKNQYLKFLALNQPEEIKIIPVIELNNHRREESFLFGRVTRSGKFVFIWENVNEGRATHIFMAKPNEDVLGSIETFIYTDDIHLKRSIFYSSSPEATKLKSYLGFFKSIRHNRLDEYQEEIEALIDLN